MLQTPVGLTTKTFDVRHIRVVPAFMTTVSANFLLIITTHGWFQVIEQTTGTSKSSHTWVLTSPCNYLAYQLYPPSISFNKNSYYTMQLYNCNLTVMVYNNLAIESSSKSMIKLWHDIVHQSVDGIIHNVQIRQSVSYTIYSPIILYELSGIKPDDFLQ